jgi:HD superfamily phosphohydrolase
VAKRVESEQLPLGAKNERTPDSEEPGRQMRKRRHESWGGEQPFQDRFEFADDVHGEIHLNEIERDAVDSPEFQRLFRLSQLGFVDLVYPTANHSRGIHSIGACYWSKRLINCLNKNSGRFKEAHGEKKPQISRSESVLISLGALLHDIPHGPFSHDIEKKTHLIYLDNAKKVPTKVKSHYGLYEKHDSFTSNPALFVFLMDTEASVLARVLRHHSPAFTDLLLNEADQSELLRPFAEALKMAEWRLMRDELLPQLLFHVLLYEKPIEAKKHNVRLRTSFRSETSSEWGLGPSQNRKALHDTWYQPFRHDIIGDTLSADLLDYLMRDESRLGMKNSLDLKLLEFYTLVSVENKEDGRASNGKTVYRCAIDLDDHKRGTFRAERLNDIFRLLDLRHQIHEKAVFHRVVQSSVAMLARAGLILGDTGKPSLEDLYGQSHESGTTALAGDDHFLHLLLKKAQDDGDDPSHVRQSIPCKLAERRVYRPLMVIPGDRVELLLRGLGNFNSDSTLEHPLRELAAIVDSPFFSPFLVLSSTYIEKLLQHALEDEDKIDDHIRGLIGDEVRLTKALTAIPKRVIFSTTPYKQLYKDPAILVRAQGITSTLDELRTDDTITEALRSRINAGLKDAETKNEGLWKLYVFLSDGLFFTGVLAKALNRHPCADNEDEHKSHLEAAQRIAVRALRTAWEYWSLKKKDIDLNKISDRAEIKRILSLFVSGRDAFELGCRGIPGEVSAVRVDQYLHGRKNTYCRDVRYRFDRRSDLDQTLEGISDPTRREMVHQAIRQVGLEGLKGEELGELVHRFANATDLQEIVQRAASRNQPIDEERLRSLWLRELS